MVNLLIEGRLKKEVIFSFIIPARNASKGISETLSAIQSQGLPGAEIIVVLNGADDGTGLLKHKFTDVKWINSNKVGRSAARNKGAQAAVGRFLVFVDADVRLEKNWLREVYRYILSLPVDAVASSIVPIPEPGAVDTILDQFRFELLKWKTSGTFLSTIGPTREAIPLVSTAACVVRKDVFTLLHGFNERLERNEDADFSLRLFQSGYVIGSCSKAKANDRYIPNIGALRSLNYLFRTFESRYFHYRPARVGDVLRGYIFTNLNSNLRIGSVFFYSLLNQLSFNMGALANWLFNTTPLSLDTIKKNKIKVRRFSFG